MAVLIAEAVHDERGRYSGGMAGDQTGDEVRIRAWYSRPWSHAIRFKDASMADRFAYAMEAAAKNGHIGYNQYRRNSCLVQARKVGYDPSKITVGCETDCSALVSLCCIYAGIPEAALYQSGNSSTTSSLRARLAATGKADVFTSKDYTARPDRLVRGDILLYEGHHVAGVVRGNLESVQEAAKEVISGKWGKGAERKRLLEAAGYDYAAVQSEVNRILKG